MKLKFWKKKKEVREYDYTMSELDEEGINIIDLMVYHMVKDGHINKDGKIEYPSD